MHRWVEFYLALKFLRPKRNYVSVITVLSLMGVMFGVMVLIVVLSVMEGFQKQLQEKIVGFNAHLTITNYGVMKEKDVAEVEKLLKETPGVKAWTPFVVGPVLVESGGRISTPFIKGIEAESNEQVVPLKGALVAGEWLLGPDSILVGDEWARRNQAWVGDKVTVYSPRNIDMQALRGEKPSGQKEYYLPSEYVIAGIFSTGFFDYDFNFAVSTIGEAQKLYGINGIHGLSVKLEDPLMATAVKERLNARFKPPIQAVTWIDQNRRLVSAVAMEQRVMSFLLFFVMLVAAFGLSSTLITVTVQKAGEIGLLKALGAREGQIRAVFTLYGFVVGISGAVLGVASGLLLLRFRNEFSEWLADTFHVEVFPAEIYNFLQIPAVVDPWTVGWIALAGVALSTGAALIPAAAAARVDPIRSLHHE